MLTLRKPSSVSFEEMRPVGGVGRFVRTLVGTRFAWAGGRLRLDERLTRRTEPTTAGRIEAER